MTAHTSPDLYAELYHYAENHAVVNTHCHHLPDAQFHSYDLGTLLRNSYLNWCGVNWDHTQPGRAHFLERLRYHAYFVWLQKSLQVLYSFTEPITAAGWDQLSNQIQQAHRKPNYHLDLLTRRCQYAKVIEDAYWDPGSDNGCAEVFAPTFRVNAFHFGYGPYSVDHDGNSPYALYPRPFITDLDEYLDWVYQKIIEKKALGCVALKLPIAYDRGLDFSLTPHDLARQAFARLVASHRHKLPEPQPREELLGGRAIQSNTPVQPSSQASILDISREDVKSFQDFTFFQICRMAAEIDLPIQIHTGMGQGRRTNAFWLQDVIQENPQTRFALLHGSYPWIEDIPALVRMYPNVYADLCWLPLGSTQSGKFLLHESD